MADNEKEAMKRLRRNIQRRYNMTVEQFHEYKAAMGLGPNDQITKYRVRPHESTTPEYQAFRNARTRCTDKNSPDYNNYGGRGIKFLFTDFRHFLNTLGLRPSDNHCIERIDNDGNYEPDNVRWALRVDQAHNRRFPRHYKPFRKLDRIARMRMGLLLNNMRNTYPRIAEAVGCARLTVIKYATDHNKLRGKGRHV